MLLSLGRAFRKKARKGGATAFHAAHERESHVGSDEQRGHEILAEAGPHAAIALVRCEDGEVAQVAERARSVEAIAGMARCRSSSLAWTLAASTTGFAPRSISRPARPASTLARVARRD